MYSFRALQAARGFGDSGARGTGGTNQRRFPDRIVSAAIFRKRTKLGLSQHFDECMPAIPAGTRVSEHIAGGF
jgi:hypothetical protein